MKKLFLFTCLSAFSLTFTGCSDDDSTPAGHHSHGLSFKLNGTLKTFEDVYVVETGNVLEVWAENSDTDYFTFTAEKGNMDGGTFSNFGYEAGSKHYVPFEDLTETVEVNTDGHLKGTFSGTWHNETDDVDVTVTEGKYDIEY